MTKRYLFLIGILLLAAALGLQITKIDSIRSWVTRLENMAYDMQMRARIRAVQAYRAEHKKPSKSPIVIVTVDDKSINREGHWPWSRAKLADLVSILQADGAVVLAMDILFSEKEENIVDSLNQALTADQLKLPALSASLKTLQPKLDNDAKFVKSLSTIDHVLGVTFLVRPEIQGVLTPPLLTLNTPQLQALDFNQTNGYLGIYPELATVTKNIGFINSFPDEDGVLRRLPLLIRYQNGLYPALALEAVRVYLLSQVQLNTALYDDKLRLEGIQFGNNIIPTDDHGNVIIPFPGRAYTFDYYSATDVLQKQFAPGTFAGKIVFIGATAIGLGDYVATTVQSTYPGIEVHATIADAILKNNFPFRPAWALGAELCFTFVIGLLAVISFAYFGPRVLIATMIILPALLIYGNAWLAESSGLILNIFIPVVLIILLALVNLGHGYLFEARRREQLKAMFGQYVPAKHIDEMLTKQGEFGMMGESREMTVLFADIRNFSTFSEQVPAAQLKEILDHFFTPMTEIIFKYNGTVDKYVGDMIMAFWGAPLRDRRHATHALQAAVRMQEMIAKLQPLFKERQWPEIRMGIGINTGMMSVGDMGSRYRRNYTVLGDTVNLGSRVEALTKYYGVNIIATEFTKAKQKKFIFRLLDKVQVKGKKKAVAIYSVVGYKGKVTKDLLEEINLSEKALALYFAQEFLAAVEIFLQLHEMHPETKLYSIYLERIGQLMLTPPPADWDGVFKFS